MSDSFYGKLIAEARRRYTDGDDAMEGAITLPPRQLHSDALARVLADELERAYQTLEREGDRKEDAGTNEGKT